MKLQRLSKISAYVHVHFIGIYTYILYTGILNIILLFTKRSEQKKSRFFTHVECLYSEVH